MEHADIDPSSRSDTPSGTGQRSWFAIGGVLTAVLAASCCVLPLILVMLGVTGAWMSNLHALEPYSSYFSAAAIVFLGFGFRHVYRPREVSCEPDSFCANPRSTRWTKLALWSAAALVLLSLTKGLWAPLFY